MVKPIVWVKEQQLKNLVKNPEIYILVEAEAAIGLPIHWVVPVAEAQKEFQELLILEVAVEVVVELFRQLVNQIMIYQLQILKQQKLSPTIYLHSKC